MKKLELIYEKICKELDILFHRIYVIKKGFLLICIILVLISVKIGYSLGEQAQEKKGKVQTETIKKKAAKEKTELKKTLKEAETIANQKKQKQQEGRPWNLILVNNIYPLDASYVPQLTEVVPEYSVDARIAEPLKRMLEDAKKDGMQMHICSAYRSVEYQKGVFNQTMEEFIATGVSYVDAYNTTAQSVAVPGKSEHALGLAVDIVSDEYEILDDKQAQTKEAKWLAENGYKYGFILRYPPEKMHETGIIYESWHYRYVGEEAAKVIMETGITLEEYLGEKE
ncbi:MAG: M15 family metallopeptidase [Lachnospiraceae bacterium]